MKMSMGLCPVSLRNELERCLSSVIAITIKGKTVGPSSTVFCRAQPLLSYRHPGCSHLLTQEEQQSKLLQGTGCILTSNLSLLKKKKGGIYRQLCLSFEARRGGRSHFEVRSISSNMAGRTFFFFSRDRLSGSALQPSVTPECVFAGSARLSEGRGVTQLASFTFAG